MDLEASVRESFLGTLDHKTNLVMLVSRRRFPVIFASESGGLGLEYEAFGIGSIIGSLQK